MRIGIVRNQNDDTGEIKMFTYTIEKLDYCVQTLDGVYIWTEDKENQGIFNRLLTPSKGEISTRLKPLREMTCTSCENDTLSLKSTDTANLPAYLQNFHNPQTIQTIRIINDSTNPLLVGMPEFLDILEAFQNLSRLYIDNCQSIFDPENTIVVSEKVTTLSLKNISNLSLVNIRLIAILFPNLKTLILNKCEMINHIDDILELMVSLFSKIEIIIIENTGYIFNRT